MRRKRARAVAFGDAMPLGSVWSGPLLAAEKAGDITGSGIKKALERMRDHAPAGLEGVCPPTTLRLRPRAEGLQYNGASPPGLARLVA